MTTGGSGYRSRRSMAVDWMYRATEASRHGRLRPLSSLEAQRAPAPHPSQRELAQYVQNGEMAALLVHEISSHVAGRRGALEE